MTFNPFYNNTKHSESHQSIEGNYTKKKMIGKSTSSSLLYFLVSIIP